MILRNLFLAFCILALTTGCSTNNMSHAVTDTTFNVKNTDNVLIIFQNITFPDTTINELKQELDNTFKKHNVTSSSIIYSDLDKEREYVLAKALTTFHADYILEIKHYSTSYLQWSLIDANTKKEVWKSFTSYITDADKINKAFEKEYFGKNNH
ncbi:hypothetical protein ACM40_09320 [Chryseobacterium sp. BLS98]|jgi:ribonuclease HIII|uniref:hypothetical protein n=1 Tax=Chryseobacterium sp. BLS98 TaxID=885586 RepID=UPI00065AC498|nr:hypothetical protein [Chryseobacterium sp. BLS98]KMQ62475.1 hypothetical protein ACM40_09320 [Chryseobacterium sp. BLS98]